MSGCQSNSDKSIDIGAAVLEEIRAVKAMLAHKGEFVRAPMSDTPGYLTLSEA